jgi:hypothetical protein
MIYDFLGINRWVIIEDYNATHQYTSMKKLYHLYVEYQENRYSSAVSYENFIQQMLQKKELFIRDFGEGACINIFKVPSALKVLDIFKRRFEYTEEIFTSSNNDNVMNKNNNRLIELLSNANSDPLDKQDMIKVLIMMQKKIGEVGLGEFVTQQTEYKVIYNPVTRLESETPIKRTKSTHLPKLEYIQAFGYIGEMIENLNRKADLGESNQEVLDRYRGYIEGLGGRYEEVFVRN